MLKQADRTTVSGEMPMKGKLVPVLFAVLASSAHAEEFGASQGTRALLADEIARHVVDECNLKRIYGKNRIDFDPYAVAVNILPEIHKKLWKNKKERFLTQMCARSDQLGTGRWLSLQRPRAYSMPREPGFLDASSVRRDLPSQSRSGPGFVVHVSYRSSNRNETSLSACG